MERSLVLIKPDAVQRGLTGTILSRLENDGLKLIALKMLQMDRSLAARHYAVHVEKPFFSGLIDYITSGPIVARSQAMVSFRLLSIRASLPPASCTHHESGLSSNRSSVTVSCP